MEPDPYRSSTPRAAVETAVEGDSKRLGTLVAAFRPPSLSRALVPASLVSVMIVAIVGFLGASFDVRALLFALPFATLGGAIFAEGPLRRRRLAIELHTAGFVIANGSRREVTVFEDVRELWWVLDAWWGGARLTGLRLVREDGTERRILLTVAGAERLVRAIELHCSLPLRTAALASIRDGETLTFGAYRIDAEGISYQAASGVTKLGYRWDALSTVRVQPKQVSFVAKRLLAPSLVVPLDRVPHPTVFLKLVSACAKKTDVDAPVLGLR